MHQNVLHERHVPLIVDLWVLVKRVDGRLVLTPITVGVMKSGDALEMHMAATAKMSRPDKFLQPIANLTQIQ